MPNDFIDLIKSAKLDKILSLKNLYKRDFEAKMKTCLGKIPNAELRMLKRDFTECIGKIKDAVEVSLLGVGLCMVAEEQASRDAVKDRLL